MSASELVSPPETSVAHPRWPATLPRNSSFPPPAQQQTHHNVTKRCLEQDAHRCRNHTHTQHGRAFDRRPYSPGSCLLSWMCEVAGRRAVLAVDVARVLVDATHSDLGVPVVGLHKAAITHHSLFLSSIDMPTLLFVVPPPSLPGCAIHFVGLCIAVPIEAASRPSAPPGWWSVRGPHCTAQGGVLSLLCTWRAGPGVVPWWRASAVALQQAH